METKQQAIRDFEAHVSSGKAKFFSKYNMDFVQGDRESCYLYDIDGKKNLFNLHCNGGVFNLGHRNPDVSEVLKQGLGKLDIGNHHLLSKYRADTAKLIASLMPGDLNYTVFGVSGGEAVDLAIKVVRSHTGRSKIISAKGGYHGHTGFALAAGDEKYRKPFGAPAPGFEQVAFGDIEALAGSMNEDTAAVILETIPATLGMVVPSGTYMKKVRRLCDERGVLLILDEVQTGLGRTGKIWAFEHYDIIPDVVVLGKGLSGGIYPISATVIRQPLESVFHEDPFIHVSTFGGSELGCLVARKVLEISSSPEFLNQVNRLSERFRIGIEELKARHSGFLLGLRQKGLMMGLELKDDLSGPVLTKAAYDNGLLIIYANNDPSVCQFLPPLIMRDEQVDEVIARLDKSLSGARRLKRLLKVKNIVDRITTPFRVNRK